MVQGIDQDGQLDEPAGGQAMVAALGPTVGPGDGDGHPSGRASLAHEDHVGSRSTPFEDHDEALAGQGVERVGDDDRVRNRNRSRRTGLMQEPWARRAS